MITTPEPGRCDAPTGPAGSWLCGRLLLGTGRARLCTEHPDHPQGAPELPEVPLERRRHRRR
jgi:hypothetical protein